MNFKCFFLILVVINCSNSIAADSFFQKPKRGFFSDTSAKNWEHGLLTGNGTIGAIVLGDPHDERLFLSHASLYMPLIPSKNHINTVDYLDEMRKLCLQGKYKEVGLLVNESKKKSKFGELRDPFIGALSLSIKQSKSEIKRYQRAVDYMTAEATVSFQDANATFERKVFASRSDSLFIMRLSSDSKQTVEFSFNELAIRNEKEEEFVNKTVKSKKNKVQDGLLYFQMLFQNENKYNPNIGFEAVGKVITKNGEVRELENSIKVVESDEILLLIALQPILKSEKNTSNFSKIKEKLDLKKGDYHTYLASSSKIHGDMMGRVSLSVGAPESDRLLSSDSLNKKSLEIDAPLAKVEKAFDAGKYNIIASTGFNPPNLMGLWSATWKAPWLGSFTTNGNLPTAIQFLLMGNTPELMEAYFRYYDKRWEGYRTNNKYLYGMRGFHVPAQVTLTPKITDANQRFVHNFWVGGAGWALNFYYDYYRYTGDKGFLEKRAYPLMKEALEFYEDFLTIKDKNGNLMFIPSYSPENAPGFERNTTTSINATMDVAIAKQLLTNTIHTAKLLKVDKDLRKKWKSIYSKLPPYEVDSAEGSFREWLWEGLKESLHHRHASHLYPLYDDMPKEIIGNPELVKAVEKTVSEKIKYRKKRHIGMSFGAVHIGLAAAHVRNGLLAQKSINLLAKYFWSDGMGSYHNWQNLFNMDISGGFPYLCASTLVYADPGLIRLLPACPPQWKEGSLKGVRLRGGILLKNLVWSKGTVTAELISDTDQKVSIELPSGKKSKVKLGAKLVKKVTFEM